MTLPPYAKAIAGSFVGALASVGTTAATTGTVDSNSVLATVVSAVAGFVLPYFVPNGKSPKAAASGLVVTVKTDVAAFLSTFAAGLPALVQSSAEAAIQPAKPVVDAAPAESAPADPSAPVTGTGV